MVNFKRLWWRWILCMAVACGVAYAADGSLGPVIPIMLGVLAGISAVIWTEVTEPF